MTNKGVFKAASQKNRLDKIIQPPLDFIKNALNSLVFLKISQLLPKFHIYHAL